MKLYGKIVPILTDAQRRQMTELEERADEFIDRAILRVGSGSGD
jgi:hypothetical protein